MTKDIIEQESLRLSSGIRNELHLYREGTFLRAYDWSAWLACRYLHEFKVNKRQFKGVDAPVAYIGFPDTSLAKWLPEGVEQSAVDDKHLQLLLPEQLLPDPLETMQADYERWKESVPLAVNGQKKGNPHGADAEDSPREGHVTLTSIMQRIMAYPIESKSPLESMLFLADVKRSLAASADGFSGKSSESYCQ